MVLFFCPQIPQISIHAPTRGATIIFTEKLINWLFQSTLLQEERQGQTSMFALIFLFQSTLLQEERPACVVGSIPPV